MPILQYKCRDCFSVFEANIASYLEEIDLTCLSCGSSDILKVEGSLFANIGGCGKKSSCGSGGGCSGACKTGKCGCGK